jgi:hypothetical protein
MKEPRPVISPSVLELAHEAGDGAVSPGEARRARARLDAALAGPTRTVVRAWAPAFAAAALALVLVTGTLASLRLSFQVAGASVAAGGYVHASGEGPASIAFSDGTRVDVEPAAAVRVANAGLRGADMVQERGRATYTVVHRPVAAWSVEAGPYRVHVTGTRFAVAWSPESGSFVTELYEGSVTVEAPSAESGVRLRAGQRLRSAAAGELVIEEIRDSAGSAEAGAAGTAAPALPAGPAATPVPSSPPSAGAPSAPVGGEPAAPSASASASAAPRSLAGRLAEGEAAAIADEIEREGIASFAGRASAADLAIAADAARYAGKPALASAALQALRARHAGTREAALAAFHLGRAAEGASPASAVTWYDTYLGETGGAGALAVEARGRKMAVVARTSGNAAAGPLAEAYLAQFPDGPHAPLARSILASP